MKLFLACAVAVGMAGCHEARSVRKTAAHPAPDWSIDKCRITYKGRLVPLGDTITKWVEMFGPPSDSSYMFNEEQPGFQFYVWDNVGIKAGAMAFRRAGHLYSMLLFLEPTIDEEVKPRFPKRPIQNGLLMDGAFVDSSNFAEFVLANFEESTQRYRPKSFVRHFELGDSLSLRSSPNLTGDQPKGALGFVLFPLTPTANSSYATEVQKLDANCVLPGSN